MAINEEKFNLCARKRPAPRKILSSRPHSGIPSLCARNSRIGQGGKTAFVFPMLLQRCATVVEAADRISSRPRWGGGILMLADASGDIASLELSNTRSQLRRPCGGASDVLFHTNAFFTDKMQEVELPANAYYTGRAPLPLRGRRIHESANVRDLRFKQLLDGNEPLDADQLSRIMADHENGGKPGDTSICKHSDYWNTTATLQLFPVSRRMRVAFDYACQAKYTEFAL